ncbi:hypothetical protein [Burkholderia gladioli]|uniref:hypothetical protein n=1 Tax=Burkholderia gladioli TaxID=28095 RepID=UPI00163E4EC2|nr:hypothetical protein [Burkholderia gladioli]
MLVTRGSHPVGSQASAKRLPEKAMRRSKLAGHGELPRFAARFSSNQGDIQ